MYGKDRKEVIFTDFDQSIINIWHAVKFARRIGVKKVFLLGHSLGATLIMLSLSQYKEEEKKLVEGLILLNRPPVNLTNLKFIFLELKKILSLFSLNIVSSFFLDYPMADPVYRFFNSFQKEELTDLYSDFKSIELAKNYLKKREKIYFLLRNLFRVLILLNRERKLWDSETPLRIKTLDIHASEDEIFMYIRRKLKIDADKKWWMRDKKSRFFTVKEIRGANHFFVFSQDGALAVMKFIRKWARL